MDTTIGTSWKLKKHVRVLVISQAGSLISITGVFNRIISQHISMMKNECIVVCSIVNVEKRKKSRELSGEERKKVVAEHGKGNGYKTNVESTGRNGLKGQEEELPSREQLDKRGLSPWLEYKLNKCLGQDLP